MGRKQSEERESSRKRKLELEQQNTTPDETEVANNEEKKKKKKKKDKKSKHLEETKDTQMVKSEEKKKKKEKRENGVEMRDTQMGKSEEKKEKKEKRENGVEMRDTQMGKSEEKEKRENGVEGEEEKKSYEGVVVSGKNTGDLKYKHLSLFSEAKLPSNVLECCKNFDKPSPIQAHAWPFLLDGRDLIGIAQTGSGKTLAFGVPAIMHILGKKKGDQTKKVNPRCLVLSPTRELAQQIEKVICEAGQSCGLKSICLYGGSEKRPQIAALKSGVDIVIATPGRLMDLMEMGICILKDASFVVLDEADRMLDMGFEQDVRSILSQTSSARQMVMFSATWPTAVHQLAQEFMDPNLVKVVVGSEDLAANHDVMQIVEVLDDRARDKRLIALLEKYHSSQRNRVIVFVLYQKEGDRVERFLQERGWNVVCLHAGKQQSARKQSLDAFKSGKCPLLIATDVAARGLDIPDVEVVINYSFPLTTEDYVHRIGRTGRAGKKGVAHTFFTEANKGLAGELANVLTEAGQAIPQDLKKFGLHVKKKESKLYGAHYREIGVNAPKATKITFGDSDDE